MASFRNFKSRGRTRAPSGRSRGSPLLNRGVKILTTTVNLNHKQSNEWKQLWSWLPPEVTSRIFSLLDVQSLCRASMTCQSWNLDIRLNDSLWKPHCLALRAVCRKEIDDDLKSGYSWRDILLRNYQKSKVKLEWLSGRYSNICSPIDLPENIMCPMDAETWGEILEAELKRCKNHKDTIASRV